jgi:hypothetical protein
MFPYLFLLIKWTKLPFLQERLLKLLDFIKLKEHGIYSPLVLFLEKGLSRDSIGSISRLKSPKNEQMILLTLFFIISSSFFIFFNRKNESENTIKIFVIFLIIFDYLFFKKNYKKDGEKD